MPEASNPSPSSKSTSTPANVFLFLIQQVYNVTKMSAWPKLPAKAAYLALNNPKRRNALSLDVLRDLRDQLHKFNTSPVDGKLRILPPFQPSILQQLETAQSGKDASATESYGWLLGSSKWHG